MNASDRQSSTSKQFDNLFDGPALSVEKLTGLTAVFDRFERSFADDLKPLCFSKPAIFLTDQKSMNLFGFMNEQQGRLAAIFRTSSPDAKLLMVFHTSAIAALTHAAFGGSPDSLDGDKAAEPDKDPTDIERRLVRMAAEMAARALTVGFSEVADVKLEAERLVVIDDVQMLGRRDCETLVIDWAFEMAGAKGSLSLILTQPFLMPMRQKLLTDPATILPAVDQAWSTNLRAGVESTRVTLNAVLERVSSSLEEVAAYKVGHVIELEGRGMGQILLECAGQDLFLCKLDQIDGRYSLEIQDAAPKSASMPLTPVI